MERINFQEIEKKWQTKFNDKIFIEKTVKILLSRNVSIPIWKNTHGPREKLYNWRCYSPLQIFEWI